MALKHSSIAGFGGKLPNRKAVDMLDLTTRPTSAASLKARVLWTSIAPGIRIGPYEGQCGDSRLDIPGHPRTFAIGDPTHQQLKPPQPSLPHNAVYNRAEQQATSKTIKGPLVIPTSLTERCGAGQTGAVSGPYPVRWTSHRTGPNIHGFRLRVYVASRTSKSHLLACDADQSGVSSRKVPEMVLHHCTDSELQHHACHTTRSWLRVFVVATRSAARSSV